MTSRKNQVIVKEIFKLRPDEKLKRTGLRNKKQRGKRENHDKEKEIVCGWGKK